MLSGKVLSGKVLSGTTLSGKVLSGKVLSGTMLSGKVLSGTMLSGKVLSCSMLSGMMLSCSMLCGWVFPATVHAAPCEPEPAEATFPRTTAARYAERGRALRRAGDDERALTCFRRAYTLSPTPELAARLAMTEQALTHWARAESYVLEALAHRHDPFVARYTEPLQAALETIQTYLGTVFLEGAAAVEGDGEGAMVWVNGERAGPLPSREGFRVPTGKARIKVRAPGFIPWSREVELSSDQTLRLRVRLRPVPPVDRTAAEVLWVSGAMSVALAVGGLVTGALLFHEREVLSTELSAGDCQYRGTLRASIPRCASLRDRALAMEAGGVGALLAGGAAAVGAALLFYLASEEDRGAPSLASGCSAFAGVACRFRF